MKINILTAATVSALLLFGTAPAIALIDNQLATAPGALQYDFSPEFKKSIEEIEKINGLKFYIYAKSYDASAPLIDKEKNAGANFADQKLAELIGKPSFDYDSAVIVTWLRNETEPTKGSIGVAPGGRLKSVYSSEAISMDVKSAIKSYMPGSPHKALLQIAKAMDSPLALAEMSEAFIVGLSALAAVASGGVLFIFVVVHLYSDFAERKKRRLTNEQTIVDVKKKIEKAKLFYQSNLDHPSILFDLKLADSDCGAIESLRYDTLLQEFKAEIDALDESIAKASVDLSKTVEFSMESIRIKEILLADFERKIEQAYGRFLAIRSNKKALTALVPPEPEVETISVVFDKNDTFLVEIKSASIRCTVPSFKDLTDLTDNLPLSYSDYSLFVKKIEERSAALRYDNPVADVRKAIEGMEAALDRARTIDSNKSLRSLSHLANSVERIDYDAFMVVIKNNIDELKNAPDTTFRNYVKNQLVQHNFQEVASLCNKFGVACDTKTNNLIRDLNRIVIASESRITREADESRRAERLKSRDDYGSGYSSTSSSGYSSTYSSNDYSSTYSSNDYSSGSSSSDYSSGSSSSDYSSDSSSSDYSSDSGGGDY